MVQLPVDPVFIFVICAFFVNGDVDCDEKWAVIIYEQVDVFEFCYPDKKNTFHMGVAGCAKFSDTSGHLIILGNYGHGKSHTGQSVFHHEIMHLQCLCNFHAPNPEAPKR